MSPKLGRSRRTSEDVNIRTPSAPPRPSLARPSIDEIQKPITETLIVPEKDNETQNGLINAEDKMEETLPIDENEENKTSDAARPVSYDMEIYKNNTAEDCQSIVSCANSGDHYGQISVTVKFDFETGNRLIVNVIDCIEIPSFPLASHPYVKGNIFTPRFCIFYTRNFTFLHQFF